MDDGNRVSADAPFWWTSLPQLHTFTLSSADALWLKGVREGALAVARTPWSDAAGRRTAQLGESQNYFVTMGIHNPDNSCIIGRANPWLAIRRRQAWLRDRRHVDARHVAIDAQTALAPS